MTGTVLKSRNDDWPHRPSLTPSHSKTPVSPRATDRIAHRRQRRHECGRSRGGGPSGVQAAWQRGGAVAATSDAPDGAAPSPPSIAPARAVVLTSLFQLVAVAMNLRLRHRRSLRAIERNLADSDPRLAKLFAAFTVLAHGEERGRAEKVKARPMRALARRLATALEFDPADPWRRSK